MECVWSVNLLVLLFSRYWIDDKDLKRGEVDFLKAIEVQFFKELIEKYLQPLDDNKDAKV